MVNTNALKPFFAAPERKFQMILHQRQPWVSLCKCKTLKTPLKDNDDTVCRDINLRVLRMFAETGEGFAEEKPAHAEKVLRL